MIDISIDCAISFDTTSSEVGAVSISMVEVAVMSIVGVIAGVFSEVAIRVGVSVGEAKPGADEVFVAGRVDV
jgi:hypothetical protein